MQDIEPKSVIRLRADCSLMSLLAYVMQHASRLAEGVAGYVEA